MNTQIVPNSVYTTREAAALLKLSTITVQKLVREKRIRAIRAGTNKYLFSGQALADYADLGGVDIAALTLETALCNLDLKEKTNHSTSPFYNLSAGVLKLIAEKATSRADMYYQIAKFINETIRK